MSSSSNGRNGDGHLHPASAPGPRPDRSHRLPPQNLDAERGVLGSILLDPASLNEIAAVLKAEDFFRAAYQNVYRVIRDLQDAGKPIDPLAVADELTRRGEFTAIGGDLGLSAILEAVPHAANGAYYAAIVRQKATLRALIDAATATLDECYAEDSTAEEVVAHAEERVFAIGEASATADTQPIARLVEQAYDRLDRRKAGEYSGVASGFVDLDEPTDGFPNGSLVVIAARPSMGKTCLATQICEYAAIESGVPVLFVSLEMNGVELAERLLVSRSRVDGFKVRAGQGLGARDMTALASAYDVLHACSRLSIDDSPLRTVAQIAANARRHKARHGLGLLVIDYLQLIESGSEVAPRASRQEQVAAISRRLKCLAKDLNIPVIALSQLNRQSENREDHRPRLADIRESGSVEQDADLVLMLHRPEYYDPNDSPGVAELIVAKNRNGATATIKLTFLKNIMRFEDHSPVVDPVVF